MCKQKLMFFLDNFASLLLYGEKEIKRKKIALSIAQYNLCENKNLCQQCHPCRLFNSKIHNDFLFLKQQEDNRDYKGIKFLRETSGITKEVTKPPIISEIKIITICNIDSYSRDAQSFLLKILEDSPKYNHFILTAENLENVLPTIQSRSVLMDSSRINEYFDDDSFEKNNEKDVLAKITTLKDAEKFVGKNKKLSKDILEYQLSLAQNTQNLIKMKKTLEALDILKKSSNIKLSLSVAFLD